MARYRHWLYRVRPAPWPAAVLALTTTVEESHGQNHNQRRQLRLGQWTATLATRINGAYAIAREATGIDARGYWSALQTAALRCRNLWVISGCFRRDAAVLGLWERLESGAIRLEGPVSRRGGRAGDGVRGSSGAIAVLQDPPVILKLKLSGGGNAITWVDAANYGIDQPAGEPGGKSASRGLAEWFIRAASTLHSLSDCGWCNTAASQAMHLYRRTFLETPILAHTEPRASALESDGLFGGRCEALRIGRVGGRMHLLDIRSAYPYVCATERLPTRLQRVLLGGMVESLSGFGPHSYLIAKVDIETDEPAYPYRGSTGVSFPVGRYTTVLAGGELADAVSAGRVRKVRRVAVYHSDPCLASYMLALKERKEHAEQGGHSALVAWLKRVGNCLHGKFAQRERQWIDCAGALPVYEWGEWYRPDGDGPLVRWRSIGGHVQREQSGGWADGAIPAIAAAVAAAGRVRLLYAMRAAGEGNVSYVDTDALIVNEDGRRSLAAADWIRPGEWGFLQPVVSADGCEIWGAKHYRIGERYRCAGGWGVGEGISRGLPIGARQPTVYESIRAKHRPADYLIPDPHVRGPGDYDLPRPPGGWVRPAELDEWEK